MTTSPLAIQPTTTRDVEVRLLSTGDVWYYQFPESIACREGQILECNATQPKWVATPGGGYRYTWLADEAYVARQQEFMRQETRLAGKTYLAGVRLTAHLLPDPDGLAMALTLHNLSDRTLHDVICEGGCFQARSPQFTGDGEVSRTYLRSAGQVTSLADLPRTNPDRCVYQSDSSAYDRPPWSLGEWFWGRCAHPVDLPVLMAMESVDRHHAIAIGYEQATAGSANSDAHHHCIHSCPHFGNPTPGESTARRGLLLVGRSADEALNLLARRLTMVDLGNPYLG